MNKLFTLLTFFLFSSRLYGQNAKFINIIFEDKDALELTQGAFEKDHSNFYLLSSTSIWLPERFSIVNKTGNYLDTSLLYLFSDSSIHSMLSETEKWNLIKQANTLKSRNLSYDYKAIEVVDTLNKPNNSYVYQLTDPIYTSDSTYAFIDAAIYYPNKTDKFFKEAYEAQMLFIFKRTKNNSWTLYRKKTTIMLW